MRLLLLTPAFPPFPGGGERYVRSLALALAQHGHEMTVLTSAAQSERDLWRGCGEGVTEAQDEGLRVIRCSIRGLPGGLPTLLAWRKAMVLLSLLPGDQTAVLRHLARAIPPMQKLPSLLEQMVGKVDLVHGFNISWEYPLLAGWQWIKQQRLPFAVTPFAHLGSATNDRVALNSTMDHQRRLLGEADVVFTLTVVEQEGLQAHGIEMKRVTTVGSGLDPLPQPADFALLQQKHGLAPPFVLFVGRNSYEKGAIHAAQAVLSLRQQGSPVNLVLVGQMAVEFERFYGRLSPTEQTIIRPLGVVSEAEKHALLRHTEMLLLPSRTDSFGIVLLEAWAHGKPVIGARAGGIPGVIDHQQNGLLVEFGDVAGLATAVQTLLLDETKRRVLGENGRYKTQTQYSWQQVGRQVAAQYEQVVAKVPG